MLTNIFAPNWLSRRPIEVALRQFVATLPAGEKVLDIGCGHKPYAEMLQNFDYVGIDASPASAADIIADSVNIPLLDQSADVILCTQTLQHVEDPVGTLEEIHRLLKNDGRLFLTVPFATKIVGQPRGNERADYWRYTEYGLRRLLQSAGFAPVAIIPLTGYAGTLAGSLNYFLASFNIPLLLIPFYLLQNTLGWLLDAVAAALPDFLPFSKVTYWHRHIYQSFPLGYIVITCKQRT